MRIKYLMEAKDHPEIKELVGEIQSFAQAATEKEQFLRKQIETIQEERIVVWNRLWDKLKEIGKLKPELNRDSWSLSFCDDAEQVFVRPASVQLAEFFS